MKDIHDTLDKAIEAKLRGVTANDTPSWESFERYRAAQTPIAEPRQAKRSLRISVRRAMSVAAVVLILLGSGYVLFSGRNQQTNPHDVLEQYSVLNEGGLTAATSGDLASKADELVTNSDVPIVRALSSRISPIGKKTATGKAKNSSELTKESAEEPIYEDEAPLEIVDRPSTKANSLAERNSKRRTVDPRSYSTQDTPRHVRRPLSIGAAASLGYASSDIAPSRLATRSSAPMSINVGKYATDVDIDNMNFSHKFPVTVGVSVRIPLSKRFSLESGLTYSYLESTASEISNFSYRYTQRSHYLGVPLSVAYSIVASKRWEFYCSAGTMVEWALSSTNTAKVYDNSILVSSTDRKREVKSALWSFNASLGVNFTITPHFGLYAEPGVSVYTENASHPITYRTQSPLSFNLRAGFRVTF